MEIELAIKILENHNIWRRSNLSTDELPMQNSKEIGIAIDTVVDYYCQSEIEGNIICDNQCKHCKEYYKPLEK